MLFDFLDEEYQREFYAHLKNHIIWKHIGLCTYPPYPSDEISWTTKIVGLRNYHDEMVWSWLAGLQLKVAKKMKDTNEIERIENFILQKLTVNKTLYEIYDPKMLRPYTKLFYLSESPFSWGLGVCLWAQT